jgi:hypothetical protein
MFRHIIISISILTISPFLNSGGSQDTITFVFDDGIALMFCGADGTIKKKDRWIRISNEYCEI